MIYYKACPRCKGDVEQRRDPLFSRYTFKQCLLCGFEYGYELIEERKPAVFPPSSVRPRYRKKVPKVA